MIDYSDPHFECIEFEQACIDSDCPIAVDEEIDAKLAEQETASDQAAWYDMDR